MKQERFKIYAAIYLLALKDGKILLMRRFNTGWSDGLYSVASGHIDGNESARKAMAREAKEEIGITIDPDDLIFANVMHRNNPDREYIDFYFMAEKWEGEPYNAEPDKCDDLKWAPLDKLPDNIIPSVKQAIESYRTGEKYSEFGW